MSKFLWALAALSLSACTGGPSGDGSDGHQTDGVDTGDTNVPPAHTGAIFVHASFDAETEICQVVVDGAILGPTEDAIVGLEPGVIDFQLGDPSRTSLDGVPFHITDDEQYLQGGGSVTVVEGDEPTYVEAFLDLAPQYHCESHQCAYPYEGGSCSNMLDEEDQWIYVGNDGVLHGSEKDAFGGQDGFHVSLSGNQLIVTSDDTNNETLDAYYNPENGSFGYTLNNDLARATVDVTCDLE